MSLSMAIERFCQSTAASWCTPNTDAAKEVAWFTSMQIPLKYHVTLEFFCCFFGLQISYLTWGIMQELIMNTKFEPTPLVPSGLFPSATFCVFSNRALAIVFSCWACWHFHGTVQSSVPLLKFTPCALSNTISSWSQYKALNYVSFNLQTLFKSTKVIPVMLMGTLLKGTRYNSSEYSEALLITLGVILFSFGNERKDHGREEDIDSNVEFFGFVLLSTYVLADSFTAQYQNKIYSEFGRIDHYHMMFGVNVSSIIITFTAMIFSGEIAMTLEFLAANPTSLVYNILTAICSTTGQVAIYYTIKRFGPITFIIIMTTRQMFSMCISTVLFGHTISAMGIIGSILVFVAVFHSIFRQNNQGKEKVVKEVENKSVLGSSDHKMEAGNNANNASEETDKLLNQNK